MRTLLLISFLATLVMAYGGRTYKIAEPDLLDEIEAKRAKAVERLKKYSQKYNDDYVQNNVMKEWRVRLSLAEKSKTERIDWVYSLEFDIPRVDNQGNVIGTLYPKGYTFRPIQYWSFTPPTLIIFDGKDKKQVEVVKKILPKYPAHMLVVSDGAVFDLMHQFNERVYLLHPKLREVGRIKEGVSVLSWDKKSGHIIKEVYGRDVLEKRANR